MKTTKREKEIIYFMIRHTILALKHNEVNERWETNTKLSLKWKDVYKAIQLRDRLRDEILEHNNGCWEEI